MLVLRVSMAPKSRAAFIAGDINRWKHFDRDVGGRDELAMCFAPVGWALPTNVSEFESALTLDRWAMHALPVARKETVK